jgi:hypothetical protein
MSTAAPAEVVTTLPAVPSGGGLVAAIAAVMNEVHVVAKRGENEFHRYRYATMGDILKEITPLLGRHGIVIFQSEVGRAMFDDDNVIAVEYAFTVAHASGETWPHVIKQTGVSTCRNSKGGWDDKSLNKCHTAARKYFLLSLFQIPTGEEDDADQGDRRPSPAQVPAVVHRVRSVAPEYVVPPPSRALKQGGIAERAITKRYEQAVRSVGPSQPFPASEAAKRSRPASARRRLVTMSAIRRRMTSFRTEPVRRPGLSTGGSIRWATSCRTTARRRSLTDRNVTACRRSSIGARPTALPTMRPRPPTSTWWRAADDEDRPRSATR